MPDLSLFGGENEQVIWAAPSSEYSGETPTRPLLQDYSQEPTPSQHVEHAVDTSYELHAQDQDTQDNRETAPLFTLKTQEDEAGWSIPGDRSSAPRPTLPPSALRSSSARANEERPYTWVVPIPGSTAQDLRTTVLGLLQDLVQQNDVVTALDVLRCCADACKTHHLSFSSILQETFEGHTAVYWAIVNRPPVIPLRASAEGEGEGEGAWEGKRATAREGEGDLVSAILAYASPLTAATREDVRLGCLHTSDDVLFQRLRRTPAFSPLTGKERLITGARVLIDDVVVEGESGREGESEEGAFVVRFRVPMFQKRMWVAEAVDLEFIAKGRLWRLSFLKAGNWDMRTGFMHLPGGGWVVKLALLPNSPATRIRSRLIIDGPRTSASESSAFASSATPVPPPTPEPIEIELNSHELWSLGIRMVVVPLERKANSLQFKESPYLESGGALVGRLEAKLLPRGIDDDSQCAIS